MSNHNDAFLARHDIKYPACGIDVGAGWIPLLEQLVKDLVAFGWNKDLHQVKEKFGGLRFYVGEATAEMYELISAAEERSFSICELCGAPGEQNAKGWIRTRCAAHANY